MPQTLAEPSSKASAIPFDVERLDRLMNEANLDTLLVTSKHSIQYLLGGYRYFFYDYLWTSPAQGDLLVRQLECTNLSGLLRDGSRPWP